jgi:hypothetical protein
MHLRTHDVRVLRVPSVVFVAHFDCETRVRMRHGAAATAAATAAAMHAPSSPAAAARAAAAMRFFACT